MSSCPPPSESGPADQVLAQFARKYWSGELRPSPEVSVDEVVKAEWAQWIAGEGPWHIFGGLTYDSWRRTSVPNREVALGHARRWLGDLGHELGRPVEAAFVALEYQRRGWPHFHPLLRLSGGLQPDDLDTATRAWYERNGYAHLTPPRSQGDVAAYASKYLAKDLDRGDILIWPLRGPLPAHQPALTITSSWKRRDAIKE